MGDKNEEQVENSKLYFRRKKIIKINVLWGNTG